MKFIFPFFPDPPKYSSNVERILCPRTLVSHTPSVATFPACSTSNKICTTSDLQRALAYLGENIFSLYKNHAETYRHKGPPPIEFEVLHDLLKTVICTFPKEKSIFFKD